MKEYPFIYLNHGVQAIKCVGKNEEIFIWFRRQVKKTEQKKIMINCPPPLNFEIQWGKEYLYLGSPGDTYEFEIIATYAPEEDAKMRKMHESMDFTRFEDVMQEALEKALPLFAKDLEEWINGVNSIVPIAFFMGPHGIEEQDDWSKWSAENVYKTAMPYLKRYRETYPEIFESENDEQYFFRGIYDAITDYMESAGDNASDALFDEVEFAFEIDGINEEFDRLETEDGDLQGNANKLESLMKDLSPDERINRIKRLKPYTQIAYLASYAAYRNQDILKIENPLECLKDLIKDMPAGRIKVIGTYLRFISENLVHVGPAFRENEKNDKTQAALAAAVMELALKYEPTEDNFIKCAMFYMWCGDHEGMLRVSLMGAKRFPDNQTIIANILYSADKAGKQELSKDFINKKSEDPLVIANQSYSLANEGKMKDAYELLLGHFIKDGKINTYFLTNLLSACTRYKIPEDSTLDKIIIKSFSHLVEDKKNITDIFINNLIILLNKTRKYSHILELYHICKINDYKVNDCYLYASYSYAALLSKDEKIINVALVDLSKVHETNPEFITKDKLNGHIVLNNIASIYAFFSNKEKMIEYLELTKKYHPDFNKLKNDTDFKSFWNDPDYIRLFEIDLTETQSNNLIQSGKLDEAYELLINYFIKNGKLNINSLNNLLYLCASFKLPEENILAKIINFTEKEFSEIAEFRKDYLLINLTILLNTTGKYNKSIEMIDLYKKYGNAMNCGLYCNYIQAVSYTNDKEMISKVLEEAIEVFQNNPDALTRDRNNIFTFLGNIACLFVRLGDKEKMLEYLKETKKYHPDFDSIRSSDDFKEYGDDPDFLKLFD